VKRASAGMQGLPGMLFERRWSAWFRGPLPSVFFFLLASPVAPVESCPAGQLRDSLGNCVPDPFGFPTNLPTPPAPTPTPAPPGTIRPADPPDATVQATYTLPFTVSESGAGETSYEFSVASTTDVSVSLTGMDRDIDCSVDGFRCTNRGGTADDSWSGTLGAGTHTVSVYPYGGGSGSWTLSDGHLSFPTASQAWRWRPSVPVPAVAGGR